MSDRRARIAETIEELTGLTATSIDPATPLAELGLDSLTLTQLAAQLKKTFGFDLGFREFFTTTQTIDAIADRIDRSAPVASVPQGTVLHAASRSQLDALGGSRSAGEMVPVMVAQLDLLATQLQLIAASQGLVLVDRAPVARVATAVAVSTPLPPGRASATPQPPPVRVGSADVGAMTPHQDAALRRFIESWGRKTSRSKVMIGDQRAVHADPRNAMGYSAKWKELVYPLVVDRSDGAYLWDLDGNRYTDLLNGFGPTFFGHRAPFVVQAIREQLDKGMELGPQTPLAGEAARLLCELTGLDRAAFACTGSEAVQAAIRIARTITGRTRIVVFAADYHGNFDEVLVRGIDGAKGPRTVPSAPGVPQRAVDDVVVLEYGADHSLEWIRAHASDLAAVMVEPIQTRHPQVQPREFLHEIRRITREAGTVFIFDEVVTGFRCHPGGAQAHYGIEADLVTYGKVLGGGMPIGVIAGRRPFIDVLDGGPWDFGDDSGPTQGVSFFAGTFVRHPLVIAAVHATLTYLRAAGPDLQATLNARAKRFVERLNEIARTSGAPIRVDAFASILFFRSTDPRNALNPMFWFFMRDHGVFLLEGYPSYLTLAHSDADLDAIVDAFRQSADAMFAAHFWRPAAKKATEPTVVAHAERFASPPVAGARLGRAPDGSAAWFVEDPGVPGRYTQVAEL